MDEPTPITHVLPDDIALDIPASYHYLNVVSGCIAAVLDRVEGLADRNMFTYQVQLAVHETCTNIVEHAYIGEYGRIRVVLSPPGITQELVILIQDGGKPFQFSDYKQPHLDEPQESGYGLVLIRNLMDEVSYRSFPGKNQWRLVKRLHP